MSDLGTGFSNAVSSDDEDNEIGDGRAQTAARQAGSTARERVTPVATLG